MSSHLLLPAALRRYADEQREVEICTGTLGAVLDDLASRFPQLERRLRDERGQLRPHVLLFVDGVGVRGGAPMDTVVAEGVEVFVAPAVSGGCISHAEECSAGVRRSERAPSVAPIGPGVNTAELTAVSCATPRPEVRRSLIAARNPA